MFLVAPGIHESCINGSPRLTASVPLISQTVTYVAVRLALSDAQRERLHAHGGGGGVAEAAPAASRRLRDVLAVTAQQFGGCTFNIREDEVRACFAPRSRLHPSFSSIRRRGELLVLHDLRLHLCV